MHNLRKACPNGNLTGILVSPKYFQLFRRNQHEAGLFSCLLYQIKQLPPPKKSFSTRKFFFKSRRFVWVSLFFMQNAASSCVNKIFTNRRNFWMPLCEISSNILISKAYKNSRLFQAQAYNLYRFKKRPFILNCRWAVIWIELAMSWSNAQKQGVLDWSNASSFWQARPTAPDQFFQIQRVRFKGQHPPCH